MGQLFSKPDFGAGDVPDDDLDLAEYEYEDGVQEEDFDLSCLKASLDGCLNSGRSQQLFDKMQELLGDEGVSSESHLSSLFDLAQFHLMNADKVNKKTGGGNQAEVRRMVMLEAKKEQWSGHMSSCGVLTKVLPYFVKYLDLASVKNLREVSKEVSMFMDNLLQDDYSHLTCHLSTVKAVNSLITTLHRFPKTNPFLNGCLSMAEPNEIVGNCMEYWSRSLKLLKLKGGLVKDVSLYFVQHDHHNHYVRQIHCDLLELLPNLEKLSMVATLLPSEFNTNVGNRTYRELDLPPLHHLKELFIDLKDNRICNTFVNMYGTQLKKLSVPVELLKLGWGGVRYFPCLEELAITFDKNTTEFSQLCLGNWTLKKITAKIFPENQVVLSKVVDMYKGTLVELEVEYHAMNNNNWKKTTDGHSEAKKEEVTLNGIPSSLPRLEKLSIINYTGGFYFLWEKLRETLKHLKVIAPREHLLLDEYGEENESEVFVKIVGLEECLYKSPIWINLPLLQSVVVKKRGQLESYSYFRSVYEYMKQNEN